MRKRLWDTLCRQLVPFAVEQKDCELRCEQVPKQAMEIQYKGVALEREITSHPRNKN